MKKLTAKGYRYTECGLDNVLLVNGFAIEESPYGKGVSIPDVEGLHKCIGRQLLDKPTPLTGAEFRFLRHELDLSQKMIGELFGRREREVRNWETARDKPVKEPFDLLIRHIYHERQDPRGTFEKLFKRLRQLDKEWHDELKLAKDDGHWRAA